MKRSTLLILLLTVLAAPTLAWNWVGPDAMYSWSQSRDDDNDGWYTNGWGMVWHWDEPFDDQFPDINSSVTIAGTSQVTISGSQAAFCRDLLIGPEALLHGYHNGLHFGGGDLTLDGVFHLEGDYPYLNRVVLYGPLNIGGSGTLNLNGGELSGHELIPLVTIGPDITVHGWGEIGHRDLRPVEFLNQGVVRATAHTHELQINTTDGRNEGLIVAEYDGQLRLYGPWDNTGGEIRLEPGGVCRFRGHSQGDPCDFHGGLLVTEGDATSFAICSASILSDLTLDGHLTLGNWDSSFLHGTITNNGHIQIGYFGAGAPRLFLPNDLDLAGTGTIDVVEGATISPINFPTENTWLTVGPGQSMNISGSRLGQEPNYYGDQRLRIRNEGEMAFSGINSFAQIHVVEPGFVNAGVVSFAPAAGPVRMHGSYRQESGSTTVDGVIRLDEGPAWFTGGTLGGEGTIIGRVIIVGDALAQPGNGLGRLTIDGTLMMSAGVRVECEVGPGGHDAIAVTDTLQLDGELFLDIIGEARNKSDIGDLVLFEADVVEGDPFWTVTLPDGWTSGGVEIVEGQVILRDLGVPTAVQDQAPVFRASLSAAPNPFNPRTAFRFELETAGPTQLEIFDASGRKVRTLVHSSLAAGRHEARWDGRDHQGRSLAAGVYLARLSAGPQRQVLRVTLVK